MHHAPSGPPLSARLFAALDRWMLRLGAWGSVLVRSASIVQRSRVVPVTLASFLLGGLALIVPAMSEAEGRPGSVALSSTSGEAADGGLFSAAGEGWTPDGGPEASRSSRDPAGTTSGTTASATGTGPATSEAAADAPSTTEESSTSTSSGGTTGTTTDSSRPPASGSEAGSGTSGRGSSGTGTPGTGTPATGTPGTGTSGSESTGTPASPSVPSEPSSPGPDDRVEAVLALVDEKRAAEGCGGLTADTVLAADAAAHSTAMRDLAFVGPASPDGAVVLDLAGRSAAVVAGVSKPSAVVSGWLASDSDAVLDCDLTSVGVGAVDGYWTLLTA